MSEREAPKTDGLAIAALVVAATAYVLPILPAIPALILASVARRRIRASGGTRRGLRLTHAATVLAVIPLVLVTVLLVVIFVGLMTGGLETP